ncbi:hypothetical protein JXR74_04555 [Candidatus Mcinerneyibacteriota bacterium]|nr:hypothetical protein [Candidatus Mcinerneyibacteriota bacterium]
MNRTLSFTSHARIFFPELRERLNQTERPHEALNEFTVAATSFLKRACDEKGVNLPGEAVTLTPGEEDLFTLHSDLLNQEAFQKLWNESDLPHIISQMAEQATNRWIHLSKHQEKTNKKIRG